MKKKIVLIKSIRSASGVILLLFLLSSCTKELFNSGITKEFTLQSSASGATYNIQVGLPYNYNPGTEKYETIYVLDGKEIFGFVANRCREISDNYGVKNVLVVSIGYGKDRSIDYTPTKISSITGGAPQFLNFIKTQLIPKMEQDYHADTSRESRVILGHSYGGLFGGYAFCVNNKVFGNYLILSPSFWFDNQVALQMERDNRATNRNRKQLVFMGIGENEETDRMLAPFETFYQSLRINYTNIKLEKNIEKNQNHMSSRNPNIIRGLEYYFQNR
ncbi:MAG: alpha/beta hydrolase [Chitinophagaceae bacterium]|nr:alpha/beta hydrolase [Chitinophagaceae bacterium]HQV62241.1 alpha/beta hydrolase-fold protein [Chitinophagaceae bacterium]HQV87255.1 alpha/beta hydrolase-fold protein [Chitinophagaceae bacterium]HQZ75555.1 alpha/beta hydrolase-fold protein [Chitinophagaceae bacterium]